MKKWLFLLVSQYVMRRVMRNPARAGSEIKRMAIGGALVFVALFFIIMVLVFRLFGWLATTFPAVGVLFNFIGLAILLLILVGALKMVWKLLFIKEQINQFQDTTGNMGGGGDKPDVIDVTDISTRQSKPKKK